MISLLLLSHTLLLLKGVGQKIYEYHSSSLWHGSVRIVGLGFVLSLATPRIVILTFSGVPDAAFADAPTTKVGFATLERKKSK